MPCLLTGNGVCNGPVSSDPLVIEQVMQKLEAEGFMHDASPIQTKRKRAGSISMGDTYSTESSYEGLNISRPTYVQMWAMNLDIAASYYAFDGVSIVIIISMLCLIGMAQQLAT